MSKPGGDPSSGISSEDVLIPTERHPACRQQREARPGSCMERENLAGDGKGKGASTFGLAVGAAWLLRACGERQCGGSTKQGYEIASSHELPSNEAHNLAHHCVRALCTAAKYSRLCRFRVKTRDYRTATSRAASPHSADIREAVAAAKLLRPDSTILEASPNC